MTIAARLLDAAVLPGQFLLVHLLPLVNVLDAALVAAIAVLLQLLVGGCS
jgi:hypothetical protein